ncbi:4Fe-4S single cluster domain-containing protein [Novosphingobium sp. P6W]|uniref:4Fe-4S single cluster domain-containing protein n=1 Tax=Novosphingobium sp. P6W TaxID=1609758 RepID=UPI0005C2DEE1|nr:4Fe-4S single cluster domain-containing protein [Novosphingobium sp. P6W]AXB75511.1 4Fe-4S cluster-binding domain-containing protein [Novosphingobium sp. P6W]KIS32473.1 radical SAM protein [Novosphingobium sp. P6W]
MFASISRIHFPVTTLGPGRRVGVWFQGCSIQCPGCISVDTWQHDSGRMPLADLVGEIRAMASEADGLTISGGEPFEQPEVLRDVLAAWREVSVGSILVFTGRELREIGSWLVAHPGLVDAVMSGPFVSSEPQTLALRGSDNQILTVLTPRGSEFAEYHRVIDASDRKLDVMFEADGNAWFAGVPARGDLARLRRAMAASGHSIMTSDQLGIAGQ